MQYKLLSYLSGIGLILRRKPLVKKKRHTVPLYYVQVRSSSRPSLSLADTNSGLFVRRFPGVLPKSAKSECPSYDRLQFFFKKRQIYNYSSL